MSRGNRERGDIIGFRVARSFQARVPSLLGELRDALPAPRLAAAPVTGIKMIEEEQNRLSSTVAAYKHNLIREMFIDTADKNYVACRFCFLHDLDNDFLWLSLHSIEKYLKAVQLFSGRSCREYGHNISGLYEFARAILPDALPEKFEVPEHVDIKDWYSESVEAFIRRLNKIGSASNRYQLYGYARLRDELFKVDQIVYNVRRSVLVLQHPQNERKPYAEALMRSKAWHLSPAGHLEQIAAEKKDDQIKRIFEKHNNVFFPGADHSKFRWRMSLQQAPSERIEMLLRSDSNHDREAAKIVFDWMLTHLKLPREEEQRLRSMRLEAG